MSSEPPPPSSSEAEPTGVVDLNVGGVLYTTTADTLRGHPDSKLHELCFAKRRRDAKGRLFLDRDGVLFRYVLDFLRDGCVVLPDSFRERERLRREAEWLGLGKMVECMAAENGRRSPGVITVGYRGSFQFGKDGLADVKFRKLSRILVCGRVALCRSVLHVVRKVGLQLV